MFVTFSSDAYENISYFNGVAKRLLELMGHSGTIPGAIKAEEVADALHHLQEGLGKEKNPAAFDDEEESEISLAKRAVPLINMLQAALKQQCAVLWMASKSPA